MGLNVDMLTNLMMIAIGQSLEIQVTTPDAYQILQPYHLRPTLLTSYTSVHDYRTDAAAYPSNESGEL